MTPLDQMRREVTDQIRREEDFRAWGEIINRAFRDDPRECQRQRIDLLFNIFGPPIVEWVELVTTAFAGFMRGGWVGGKADIHQS